MLLFLGVHSTARENKIRLNVLYTVNYNMQARYTLKLKIPWHRAWWIWVTVVRVEQ